MIEDFDKDKLAFTLNWFINRVESRAEDCFIKGDLKGSVKYYNQADFLIEIAGKKYGIEL